LVSDRFNLDERRALKVIDPTPAGRTFWPAMTTRGLMALIAALSLFFGARAMLARVVGRPGERARRAQCVNNLKQIGLAIWEYEEKAGAFPVGTVANPRLSLDRRLGWNFRIVPNLEIPSPVAPGDLTLANDDPVLRPLRANPPNCELCPTLQRKDSANYVGIAGLGVDSPALPKTDPRAGIFGDDRVVTPADILDGNSNTMMVIESTRKAGPWLAGGRATVRGLDPSRPPYLGPGGQFGGIHVNGSNVLMADGSVRFIKDTVDPKVFEALSTIAGGEKVSVPWQD
jgi:prepilin-type processing-associated H-X9-DG protein